MPDLEINNINNKVLMKENTALVVEDNHDILRMISSIMSKYYNVLNALNGEQGLELARNRIPDIIISDILMPVMDGIAMCIKIKENPVTSHIPVVLLTAVDSMESNIKGLEVGADAYLTKPFSEVLLISTVQNLIQSRNRLKERYGYSKLIDNLSMTKDKNDQEFIKKVIMSIYENIEDESFTLNSLATSLNLSRSSLYKKIKRISNLRAIDFVKNVKLHYAAKLLLSNNLTINEIAWKSGFSDVKYFSKCFNKQYKSNPSDFKKKLNGKGTVVEMTL